MHESMQKCFYQGLDIKYLAMLVVFTNTPQKAYLVYYLAVG